MAILRGQDGPNILIMACIPTNDSTVFTCAGRALCAEALASGKQYNIQIDMYSAFGKWQDICGIRCFKDLAASKLSLSLKRNKSSFVHDS